jgi:HAD superfamily hydrolase (TIGR01509 family)
LASIEAVIFDLGNTLVMYFDHEQWPGVLEEGIDCVARFLVDRGHPRPEREELARRVAAQRGAKSDQVVPLRRRLAVIFSLPETTPEAIWSQMEQCFCGPVFARARLCEDSLAVIEALKARKLKTAILSNTPWGTPGRLWRAHLKDLGLLEAVDVVTFCDDVGWRKPDPRAFQHVLGKLSLPAHKCLFVGDEPRWDVEGPRAVGMQALHLDRRLDVGVLPQGPIADLGEMIECLDA